MTNHSIITAMRQENRLRLREAPAECNVSTLAKKGKGTFAKNFVMPWRMHLWSYKALLGFQLPQLRLAGTVLPLPELWLSVPICTSHPGAQQPWRGRESRRFPAFPAAIHGADHPTALTVFMEIFIKGGTLLKLSCTDVCLCSRALEDRWETPSPFLPPEECRIHSKLWSHFMLSDSPLQRQNSFKGSPHCPKAGGKLN